MGSIILTQNFDGSGSLPGAPWSFDAGWAIDSILFNSSPNSVNNTTASLQFIKYANQDGLSGQTGLDLAFFMASNLNSPQAIVAARSTANNNVNNCYEVVITPTAAILQRRVGGASQALTTYVTGAQSRPWTGFGAWYIVKIECEGSTIRGRLIRVSDGFYLNTSGSFQSGATYFATATDTTYTGQGYYVMAATMTGANQVNIDDINIWSYAVLTVGAQPTVSALETDTVTLTGNAPTGGTPGYTYQWYRSTTANFTPGAGNILNDGSGVSGATTLVLVDGSIAVGTDYFYKLVASDANAATVTTGAVVVRPGTLPDALQIVWFGDSIGKGAGFSNSIGADNFPGYASEWLTSNGGFRSLIYRNAHVSGSDSSNGAAGWGTTATSAVNGSDNTMGGQGAVRYLDAMVVYATAAFGTPDRSTNPVYACCNLGRNDAFANTAAATFYTQMLAITNSLIASGFFVVLDAPTFSMLPVASWPDTKTDLVVAYLAELVAVQAACNDPTACFVGETEMPYCFGMNGGLTSDGTHPTSPLSRRAGERKALKLLQLLNTHAGVGGGGGGGANLIGNGTLVAA